MKPKPFIFLLTILVLFSSMFLSSCCWASELAFPPQTTDEIVKISGDFGLTTWSYGGYVLVGNYSNPEQRYVAVQDILKIGWNDEFIVTQIDSSDYPWHVIITSTNQNFFCGVENPLANLGSCIGYEVVADLNLPDHLNIRLESVQDVFERLKEQQR
jgi:hypothetical protein